MGKNEFDSFTEAIMKGLQMIDKELQKRGDTLKHTRDNDFTGYNEFFSENVGRILKSTSNITPISMEEYQISKDEMINLVLDFYKTLSPEIYEKARKIINNEDGNIFRIEKIEDQSKEKGYMTHSYEKKKNTIVIPDTYTLRNAMTLVHELGHTMDETDVDDKEKIVYNFGVRNSFSETTAVTFEKIFLEYLWNNTNYPKEAILDVMIKRHNYLIQQGSYHMFDKIVLILKENDIPLSVETLSLLLMKQFAEKNNHEIDCTKKVFEYIQYGCDSYLENLNYANALLNSEILLMDYQRRGNTALDNYLDVTKNPNKESYFLCLLASPVEDIMTLELNRLNSKKNEVLNKQKDTNINPINKEAVEKMLNGLPEYYENAKTIEEFVSSTQR